jgi:ABC-2 type transport system permease protein
MDMIMDNIQKTLAVALKELQVFAKDTTYMFTIFLLPLLISIPVSVLNAGSGEGINLPVILVDHDPGKYSDDVVDILEDIDELEMTRMASVEDAESLVAEVKMIAAIIIPADFTERVEAYEPTKVQVVVDPAQAQYATMITTIMEEVIEPVAIQGEINYGMDSVMGEVTELRTDPKARVAAEAQNEGVMSTQLDKMQNDPDISVKKEDLEGAEVQRPENLLTVFMPGFTVMFAFFLMPALGVELLREREEGSLRRLLAAPISRGAIIAGKMLAYLVIIMLQITLVFGIGALIFELPLGNSLPALFLVTAALGLAATALGMMIAALARSRDQAGSLALILIFVLAGIGGCIALSTSHPIYRMEGPIGFISRLTPHAHALEGYQRLMNEGAGLLDILPQVAILFGMTLIFFVVAMWRFRFES